MIFVIIVSGSYSTGKTTFIETLCDDTGKLPIESIITPAYYWGGQVVDLGSDQLFLVETPGAQRFDWLWSLTNYVCLGVLVMANSAEYGTFTTARSILETMRAYTAVPVISVANYQDKPYAFSAEDLGILFNSRFSVLPCVATDLESVKAVVINLLEAHLNTVETDI